MFIDTHVHFRDGKQAYKETIKHGLFVAYRTGFSAVASVGNGDPATTDEDSFLFYQDLADKSKSPVQFFQWILLTPETKQVENAIELWHKYEQVIGLKMFRCHSVGDTKVDQRKKQRKVAEILAKNDFRGVWMNHCEKEDYITKNYDPKNPISHCADRPPFCEISSISDLLDDVIEFEYKGKIHIAHGSCPESVDMRHRHSLKDRISIGVGPQHLLMFDAHMCLPGGIYRKKNPALRDFKRLKEMQRKLIEGKIDNYESDHAPHSRKEKLESPYLSGFPQLPIVPLFVKVLKLQFGMTDEQILNYMFNGAKKLFSPKLDKVESRKEVSLKDLDELIKEVPVLRKEYEYDAWEGIL